MLRTSEVLVPEFTSELRDRYCWGLVLPEIALELSIRLIEMTAVVFEYLVF